MTRLQDLLTKEVADFSPSGNLDGALRSGRRRLLVRRAASAGGAAVLTAVLVGAIALATTNAPDRAEPAGPKLGVKLTLDDAVPAQEGTDYTEVRTVTAALDHDESFGYGNNETQMLLTEDGQALRQADEWKQLGGTEGGMVGVLAVRAKFTLVDPATGAERVLPVYDQWLGRPLRLGADKLYFQIRSTQNAGDYQPGAELPTRQGVVAVFDRTTWTWSALNWAVPKNLEWTALGIGADGRMWLAGTAPFDRSRVISADEYDDPGVEVWSGALGDNADARRERPATPSRPSGEETTQVGSWLIWRATVRPANEDTGQPDAIALDTADGTERSIDGIGSCGLLWTRTGGGTPLLVTDDDCREARSALHVRTLDGIEVLELAGERLSGNALNERFLGVTQVSPPESAPGTYASYLYELASGKLMRMPSRVVAVEGELAVLESVVGSGDDKHKEFTVINLN